MKYFYATTILLAIFISFAAFGQSPQAEKTVIKSIPIQTAATATFELPGEVSASEWDKEYIRVTATIKVLNSSENILDRLIMVGRYEIQATEVDGELIIQMPKMMHHIAVKGVDLEEVLEFEVNVPKNFVIKTVYPDYYQAQPMM
jgi:hypothetical protein